MEDLVHKVVRKVVPIGREVISYGLSVQAEPGFLDPEGHWYGEQRYGPRGWRAAKARGQSALERFLVTEEKRKILVDKRIGQVLVATTGSYIHQPRNPKTDRLVGEPVEYNVIIFYNAMTDRETVKVSRGVPVPISYFAKLKQLDTFAGRIGTFTFEKILGRFVPAADEEGWQKAVSGISRHDLVKEAMKNMDIPYEKGPGEDRSSSGPDSLIRSSEESNSRGPSPDEAIDHGS